MCKCKYAGDPEDEYCKSCDGISMIVDGKESSCTECAGYEAGENVSEEEFSMPEPQEPDPIKEKPKKEDNKKKENKVSKKADVNVNLNNEAVVPKAIPKEIDQALPIITNVTMLRYMSGATICHNDTYYKFECCEERKLPEGLSEEQVQEEREKLWSHLNGQIDSQIAEVLGN